MGKPHSGSLCRTENQFEVVLIYVAFAISHKNYQFNICTNCTDALIKYLYILQLAAPQDMETINISDKEPALSKRCIVSGVGTSWTSIDNLPRYKEVVVTACKGQNSRICTADQLQKGILCSVSYINIFFLN